MEWSRRGLAAAWECRVAAEILDSRESQRAISTNVAQPFAHMCTNGCAISGCSNPAQVRSREQEDFALRNFIEEFDQEVRYGERIVWFTRKRGTGKGNR